MSSTCMPHGRVSQSFIFSTLHACGRGKEVEAWIERLVCCSRDSAPCLGTRGATVERTEGDLWAADLAIKKSVTYRQNYKNH